MKNRLLFKIVPVVCCWIIFGGCTNPSLDSLVTEESSLKTRSVMNPERMFCFPVLPDSEGWANFSSLQEKLDACQIPEALLSEIPTEELVEICMEYPLLINAYAYNNPVEGMKKVVTQFNGFGELFKREDNCVYLFNYLKAKGSTTKSLYSLDILTAGRNTLYFALAEILLSFEEVLKNSDNKLKKEIAVFSYSLLEDKEKQPEFHGLFTLSTSVYLCGQVVALQNPIIKKDSSISSILTTGEILDPTELQTAKTIIKNSINNM